MESIRRMRPGQPIGHGRAGLWRWVEHSLWCAWRTGVWSRVRPRQVLYWVLMSETETVMRQAKVMEMAARLSVTA